MNNIQIEKRGMILEGENKDWHLFIQNDSENTGSYLILVTPPSGASNYNAYDNWVEDYPSLEEYFKEANWRVDWNS